jgi:rsbT antagonist protein RsbS
MTHTQTLEGNIPVLSLWGRLVVPLQGDIGDLQVEHLRDTVLARLRDSDASGLAIDVSGVWVLDSHICSVVGGIASAARLLGAEAVLCGLSPESVLTLQAMDIGLDSVRTAVDLEEALELLGIEARAREPRLEDDILDDPLSAHPR